MHLYSKPTTMAEAMAEAMADRLRMIVACSGVIKRLGSTRQDWYIYLQYVGTS